ncbi:MAG: hypothetical protein KDA42_17610 [Planctomycetales bacterium]|nr:hypothetical protein [Planctomycetales bacterium]
MSRLSPLRQQILALLRQRRAYRLMMGLYAIALAIAAVLGVIFLFDVALEATVIQRLILIGAGVGVGYWAVRRFAAPWLASRESLIDVALQVEKHQQLDSDLVAALQFESPAARQWGSEQLEHAVVQYVSDTASQWNLARDLPQQSPRARAVACGLALGAWLLVAILYPGHVAVFFERLLLASTHYPTRTRIEQIVVNGKNIDLVPASRTSGRAAYGQPVKFRVTATGEIPADGQVVLRTTKGGTETVIDLQPAAQSPDGRCDFVGELPRMIDAVNFQLFLGDAWTDPARLGLISLPVVEATFTPHPPRYAQSNDAANEPTTARQIAVLEGSRIDLSLSAKNKSLKSATLLIGEQAFPLQASADANTWQLPAEKSPLERVTEAISYRIEVEDEDGLAPDRPLSGFIRIKADRPPQIQGSIITRFVLPTAEPKISFRAADDYGIASVAAQVQIHREDQPETTEHEVIILAADQPLTGDSLPLRGEHPLSLSQFTLSKGDRVEVRLRVTDFRGDAVGEDMLSEPLVFHVTDESGVMAAISETDELSARKLDDIIKRQLGIGASP